MYQLSLPFCDLVNKYPTPLSPFQPYHEAERIGIGCLFNTADFIKKKKNTFSVHSFNDDYLSLSAHEIPGSSQTTITVKICFYLKTSTSIT